MRTNNVLIFSSAVVLGNILQLIGLVPAGLLSVATLILVAPMFVASAAVEIIVWFTSRGKLLAETSARKYDEEM